MTGRQQHTTFITGGFGYLGSMLAQRLLRKGEKVVLYDNLFYRHNRDAILDKIVDGDESRIQRCEVVESDTCDKDALKNAIESHGPDWIVHFGELVGVYACEHNPVQTKEINWQGTCNVIDIACELDIPLLYNSSSSVYGTQKDNTPLPEDHSLPQPCDLYCIYKLQVERYISDAIQAHKKWRAIVFRPATVCGPAPRMRIELLPNHFTYSAIAKGRIAISQPEAGRAVIDVRDMTDAYELVLGGTQWKELVYNIGHYNWAKGEYARRVVDVVGGDIVSDPSVGDARNLGIDSSRFEREYAWKPRYSFEESVRDIAEWITEHKQEIEENNFRDVINMPLDVWKRLV